MKSYVKRAGANRLCNHIILPATLGLLAGQAVAAPLFPNGGFEEGITGWSVAGNAAIKQSAPSTAVKGSRLIAFNSGNTLPNGTVSRSFPTVPGDIYQVTFATGVLAYQYAVQRMGVTVNGSGPLLSESVSLTGRPDGQVLWTVSTYYFIADGSTATIAFRDLSLVTNGVDLLLDDVVVEPTTAKPLVNGGLENGAWGWTATGNVRAIPVPAYFPTEGRTAASFNTGDTAPNGVLSQTVSTVPGRTYLLSFDAGILTYGRGWQKMETHISGSQAGPWQFSEPGGKQGTVDWRNASITFTAHEDRAKIEFRDTSDETRSVDLLLDNVRLLEVPPGFTLLYPDTFLMGSPADEYGHAFNEMQHAVSFTNHLLAKTTEVTWAEWREARTLAQSRGYNDIAVGRNGATGSPQGDHPVTEVSWWDVIKWCNLRSESEGLKPVYYSSPGLGAANVLRNGTPGAYADWAAEGYRLPTEAEWEYLCRAGSLTAYFNGPSMPRENNGDATLDVSGWYDANSGFNTHPVATRIPNAWGLYDTHGNIWEWCWDLFDDTDYSPLPVTDPKGPAVGIGPDRMIRGGSYHMLPYWLRSAQRAWHDPSSRYFYLGFRPVRQVIR